MSENTPLLQVVDLTTHFPIAGGGACSSGGRRQFYSKCR